MKTTSWTKKELEALKKYYPIEGKYAAERFPKRTVGAVLRKAGLLKLEFKGDTSSTQFASWRSEEDQVLKQHYENLGSVGITARNLLPNRSRDAILIRAARLQLVFRGPKNLAERGSTDEQKLVSYLRKGPRSVLQAAEYLDRSPSTVQKLVAKLRGDHYNIQLLNEGEEITLTPDPARGGHEVINVEKYFGSNREVAFGVISDLHYGNVHSRHELIQLQYEIFKKEGIEIVFNCGNMIDGEIHFNRHELLAHGVDGQIQYFIKHVPQIEGVTTYFITGDDHEGWIAHSVGLNIGQKIQDDMEHAGRNDWRYLGFLEADVQFKTREGGTCVRLAHPGGGTAYALSYTLQKIVESLQGGEKPHVYLSGHYHKMGYWNIRNVHTMLVGCMEDQTTFMRKLHIEAQLGAWIVRMSLAPDGTIRRFVPQAYPYFDRKVYTSGVDFKMPGIELVEPKKKLPKPTKVL